MLAEFGASLRAFRKAKDLSIEVVADSAGVHPNYLGEVERGMRNVSLFNIWRLAAALGLPSAQLLEALPARKSKPAR